MSMVGRTRAFEAKDPPSCGGVGELHAFCQSRGNAQIAKNPIECARKFRATTKGCRLSNAIDNSDDRYGLDAASAEWLNHHAGDLPISPLLVNP
jgi:hypothetical protein